MARQMVVFVAICTVLLFEGVSALKCYDCGTEVNRTKCNDPIPNLVESVHCNTDGSKIPICYSFFLNSTVDNVRGVYRGCYNIDATVQNATDLLVQEFSKNNNNVTICEVCKEEECNSKILGNGAQTIKTTLFTLLISVFCTIILRK